MWSFLLAFIPRAIVQGIPLLYGSTGEIITEKSGNLNLGIPGVMYVGGICVPSFPKLWTERKWNTIKC